MVKRSAGELLFAIAVDRKSEKSVTAQVYGAVKHLIVSGDLAVGKRLPSSRTIARELAISRTTAIQVFERLASEGLIVSRTGSGSFVSDVAEAQRPRGSLVVEGERQSTGKLADLMAEASPRFFQRLPHPQKPRAFVTGLPAFDAFPLGIWSRLSAKHWREPRDLIMGYSDPNGLSVAEASDRRAFAGQPRHRLRGRADLHRQRRAAGLRPDRPRPSQSRRPCLVRESGHDRGAQLLHRLRGKNGRRAGRCGRPLGRGGSSPAHRISAWPSSRPLTSIRPASR